MTPKWIRPLFVVAALYDGILGLAFALAFRPIYARFGIALPNHDAYVQLPSALIAVFGLGFWFVSRAPERLRELIVLGVLLKLAFSGIVLGHWLFGAIPPVWVAFAVADAAFLVAFLIALSELKPAGGPARA